MILRGWKNICKAAGGMSAATARKLVHEGMPVSIIAGSPMTTTEALEEWVKCRCQNINLKELSAHLTEAVIRDADK